MLQFKLMNPDGDVGSFEIRKPASVVEMKMAHDNGFHILDVVSSLFNRYIKFLVLLIIDASKNIIERSAPDLRIVRASPGLKQNQLSASVSSKTVCERLHMYPFCRMLDEDRDDDAFSAHSVRIRIAFGGRSALRL